MENENQKNSSENKQDATTAKSEEITKNKKSFFKFAAIFVLVLATIIFFGFYGTRASNSAITGNVIANNGDVQIVKMHVENGRYVIEPSSFKQGVPVRIEADISRMPGCSKSVVISAFNVKKNLNANDNIIEFTPDKAGTFNIVCSMNMYKGTFTVLQADGAQSNYVEKTSTAGATCGAGGGGCGCGG